MLELQISTQGSKLCVDATAFCGFDCCGGAAVCGATTVTFGGEWIPEGVALEININPTITGEGFRTLIRWR